MKKIIIIPIMMLLYTLLVFADGVNEPEFSAENTEDKIIFFEQRAGVTPDSPFYPLDCAMEKVALALTVDETKKIERRLQIAEERFLEAKQMTEEDKIEKAEIAEEKYDSEVRNIEREIDNIEEGDNTKKSKAALDNIAHLQERIGSHYHKISLVKERILEQERKNRSPEQMAQLEEIFEKIKSKAKTMEEQSLAKGEQVKNRLKDYLKSDDLALREEEIDKIIFNLEENAKEKAKDTAEKLKAKAKERVEGKAKQEEEEESEIDKSVSREQNSQEDNGQ